MLALLQHAVADPTSVFILGQTTTDLVNSIRIFVAPVLLIIISFIALTFLFKRQMTQFLQFIVIAVVVAALFYSPEILTGLGKSFGENNSDLTWETS